MLRCCFPPRGVRILTEWSKATAISETQRTIMVTRRASLPLSGVACVEAVRFISRASDSSVEEKPSRLAPERKNPMEVLHRVFQSSPKALHQHRELMICLAEGDVDGARFTAAALAKTIIQCVPPLSEKSIPKDEGLSDREQTIFKKSNEEMLRVGVEKITNSIPGSTLNSLDGETLEEVKNVSCSEAHMGTSAPWNSTTSLRAVVLETLFETPDTEGVFPSSSTSMDASGTICSPLTSASGKAQAEVILNQYLSEEEQRWKNQKHVIVSIVLDLAKSIGLTPLDLHACEKNAPRGDSALSKKEDSFNPLTHTNFVIRGEIPDWKDSQVSEKVRLIDKECQKELETIKKRILGDGGEPIKPEEEEMALYELYRTKTVVRYSVGIHRDLQAALNTSKNVKQFLELSYANSLEPIPTGAEYFASQAIRLLNSDSYKEILHKISVDTLEPSISVETPVIPFTFMLKCCLWFEL